MRARRLPSQTSPLAPERPLIGLAFIDVLADYTATLAGALHDRDGLTFTPDEIRHPRFDRLLLGDDHNLKRLRWFRALAKNPELIAGLPPVAGIAAFWNSPCLARFARRIVAPATLNEQAIQHWCARHGFDASVNVVRGIDGWQRQTRARWIVTSDPVWAASVEDQAIAFRSQCAGIQATSFFDIESVICQSEHYE